MAKWFNTGAALLAGLLFTGALLPGPGVMEPAEGQRPPSGTAEAHVSRTVPAGMYRIAALDAPTRSHREEPPEPDEPEPEVPQGVDCAVHDCVALTFDDGPVPGTGQLLDILAERDVPATFFLIGRQIEAHRGIVERMVTEGHVVGSHSWDHLALPSLDEKGLTGQITPVTDALTAAGVETPTLFRPPYGDISDEVVEALGSHGYATILWNVDPEDWRLKKRSAVEKAVLEATQPGSIILLHDIHQSTIDAVPGIISKLRKKGYTFVTVPDLFEEPLEPGRSYRHRDL